MPFDFEHAVGTPFRMQPGLRRLATGAAQLTPARPGSAHQREKLSVLSAFAGDALVQRDGFDPAPALHALCRHAAVEHPRSWQWDGRVALACGLGVGVDAVTGSAAQHTPGTFGLGDEVLRCLSSLAPAQRLTALLCLAFEEDFALVDAASATVPWMAVCLPSHWAPRDKVGRHFAAIHAPVPDADRLRQAGAALARLVAGDERWERFVWNVTDHPRLHAHPTRVPTQRWTERDPLSGRLRAWWRTERQTFLPIPDASQSLFLIHVQVRPLDEAVDTSQRAGALAQSLASMSPAVLAYRNLAAVRDELVNDLQALQAARPPRATAIGAPS